MSLVSPSRRRTDVLATAVTFIGSAGMVYALSVGICAILGRPVPEGLTALASGGIGYLAGVLTPRPHEGAQPVTVINPPSDPLPVTETTPEGGVAG